MEDRDIITLIIRLQLELAGEEGEVETATGEEPQPEEGFLFDGPEALTIKEAMGILKASRDKVDDMRRKGELTSYYRNRQVRLDRCEVERARKWWSVRKGKV